MNSLMQWVTMGFLGCVLVAVPQAPANPINITVSGGVGVEAAPASDLGNFGDATVLNWLKNAVDIYNQGFLDEADKLPANGIAAVATGLEDGAGGDSIFLDFTSGVYDYVFLHWGGKKGGWAQAFYIKGLTGYTFDNSLIAAGAGHPDVGGLSFYSFYDPPPSPNDPTNLVPDGGTTLLLLGATLCCVGLIRRKLRTA